MAVRGIKTKIAFNVAILVLLSAIIADLLVVAVVQGLLVRQEVEDSRHVLEAIGQSVLSTIGNSDTNTDYTMVAQLTAQLGATTHLTHIQVADDNGTIRYKKDSPVFPGDLIESAAQGVRQSQKPMVKDIGMVWTVFWWHPTAVILSIPIMAEDGLVGVASGISAFQPIYTNVSKLNKPILLYILINTIILTIVGLYRIFKLYLRPIDRIVRQADDYHEDGDLFFAFRQEDNQLNRLSSALNRMLNRIKADKETLQNTVVSLGQANTALKEAQKKIIQTEKMASVGRLASGIAHEIGNPIGIVLGYIDLLKKSDLNSGEEKDFLRRTEAEVQRINTVIRQLLDLARPKDPESRMVELDTLIDDIMAVMQMQPSMSRIQFNAELDPGHPSVWANADQLRQVFLNLLLNSADAIQTQKNSDGGSITIRTVSLKKQEADTNTHIQIRFEDNGIGMNAETLDNIFDPFYTTKEPGKGTGLGLSVSYMIIEGMGGALFAESQAGQGSTFTVELPIVKPNSNNQVEQGDA